MTQPNGICHICSLYGPLTFEHVPPRKAFNARAVRTLGGLSVLGVDAGKPLTRGQVSQRGAGAYTLCDRCNNEAGSWYGPPFIAWCVDAAGLLIRSGGMASLYYPNYVLPLPVLKQIVTMFFSVNAAPGFATANPELVRFVRNRHTRYLPPRYRFFVYYTTSTRFRYLGVSATINFGNHRVQSLSEIAFPPFGFVLTFDSGAPDDRLVEITHFAQFASSDLLAFSARIPVLPVATPFPADYRSQEQVAREAAEQQQLLDAERGSPGG